MSDSVAGHHFREPMILTVAPNGAFKTVRDHARIPLTAETLATTARACLDAGACMMHMHVRDGSGRHLLDANAYQTAIAAVRKTVGDDLVIQITSESAGRYKPEEQIAVIQATRPEAVSVAIRELIPDAHAEPVGAALFEWLYQTGVMTQVILYSADELRRYQALRRKGTLPPAENLLLFVLGCYSAHQQSHPMDVLPFLRELDEPAKWSVCAFGPEEFACLTAAVALGGHARTGFENNLLLPDGQTALDNAQLVSLIAETTLRMNRPLATARQLRELCI